MNTIREIQALNKRELENSVPPSASWHADYRDTAYIYIGGLSFNLTEGDIITIFSQYGEPVYTKLIRDKDTGKSKGFAFLKYEDQRSTDLAVDNLGGSTVLGRVLKVDHTRYKRRDDEDDDKNDMMNGGRQAKEGQKSGSEKDEEEKRPLLKEEQELTELINNHDDDDPMKDYLVQEKKQEVAKVLRNLQKNNGKESNHRHRHRSGRDEKEKARDIGELPSRSRRRGAASNDSESQERRHHSLRDL